VVSVGAGGCGHLGKLALGLEIGDWLAVTKSQPAWGLDKVGWCRLEHPLFWCSGWDNRHSLFWCRWR
jgi:hypothetical protein